MNTKNGIGVETNPKRNNTMKICMTEQFETDFNLIKQRVSIVDLSLYFCIYFY